MTETKLKTQDKSNQKIAINGIKSSVYESNYSSQESAAIAHMEDNKFECSPRLPLDTSGKRVDFIGRNRSKVDSEWYIASVNEKGMLVVTYNSHHASLKRDKNYVFTSTTFKPLDEKERAAQRERVAELKLKRDEEEAAAEKARQDKAKRDQNRFNKALVFAHSPYIVRKKVKIYGIRFEVRNGEVIVLVPMRDEHGEIQGLEEIYPTKRIFGTKKSLRDKNYTNSTKGLFHVLGDLEGANQIFVTTGYATAASAFEATSIPTIAAFDDQNVDDVVAIFRKKSPTLLITILADDDWESKDHPGEKRMDSAGKERNPGKEMAMRVAEQYGCTYVLPTFPSGFKMPDGRAGKDFNDIHTAADLGLEEVAKQLTQPATAMEKTSEKVQLIPFETITNSLIRNERGDAELFLTLLKDKYLFDSTEGKSGDFYIWQDTHWALDRAKQRYRDMELVSSTYEKASIEAGRDEDKKDLSKELNKRAFNLRAAKRCKSVFEFIATEIHFNGEWDYCPGKLPCLNGIVDLKTGKLSEHLPEFYLRSVCPTKYNPFAKRPLFDKFLDDITLGNKELQSFLGRLYGFSLLGLPTEEIIVYLYGKKGRNGKGTLMQSLEKVLGSIAKTFPAEMILLQRNPPSSSTPRPEKANLQGVRFAIFSEIDEKRQIDTSEIKNLSGRDTISCRRLFSNIDVQISPSHTMFIQTNFKPKASAKDDALWKRNILIPFNAEFVNEPTEPHQRKKDEGFKEKLLSEREGILNWLIAGCLEYQRIGLAIPDIVKDETANYRKENDGIQLFIDEKCTLDPILTAPAGKLRTAIQEFCRNNGHQIPNEKEIPDWLKKRFGEPKRSSAGLSYQGVGISPDEFDER